MQQVNLYQEQFQERREPLGIGVLVVILMVVMLLLAGTSFLQSRQMADLAARAQSLQARQQALTETLTQISGSIAGRRANPELADAVQDLSEQLREKQTLADSLESLSVSGAGGFSAQLTGVARQRVEGLWFTGVDLEQGGKVMGLYGTTLQADNVAEFVDQLKHESVFAGAHFNVVKLTRQEANPDWLDFSLQTRPMDRE